MRNYSSAPNFERFWSKVDKTGKPHPTLGTPCWLWMGTFFKHAPYGSFWDSATDRNRRAHRVAYELCRGVPAPSVLMHQCDVPACVNPDHLKEGDQKTNLKEMIERGRSRAINAKRQKISDADIRAAKKARAEGAQVKVLAAKYGVSVPHLSNILSGRRRS